MYGAKAGLTSRLDPVLGWLAAREISPDAITLAAVPVSLLLGLSAIPPKAVPGEVGGESPGALLQLLVGDGTHVVGERHT